MGSAVYQERINFVFILSHSSAVLGTHIYAGILYSRSLAVKAH